MMKRIVQTTTATNNRKVYGGTSQQTVNSPDMNPMNSAVRKIHNLLSSGAVTVTGPNQPRILKQKVGTTIVSSTTNSTNNVQQNSNSIMGRCYICDDATNGTQNQMLTDMVTSHTSTKFPNKIGQLVGEAFMVIVSVEDVVCPRCNNLINYLDRLENDVERVRNNIMNLLHKKYGLNDESISATTTTISSGGGIAVNQASASPPIKMQKMNSGNALNRVGNLNDDGVDSRARKVSAVQQIKITPPQIQQQQQQQLQKKTTTKIYKCLSCDFKTPDLKLFNPHYETCKQQNFHCKICKKIFANLTAMKQHMAEKHGVTATNPISNTSANVNQHQSNDLHSCQLCQVNFTSELALKKHMEVNHNEYKQGETTQLYTCNHCQFKSTDKSIFDEHMRKHVKPKPFKCRLCSTRFETREQATIHAKAHQPNYFKCGTCSLSFPKREMLVKHFEVHQTKQQPQQQQQPQQVTQIITQQQQPTQSQPHIMTTQKLLQETIDEALSESATEVGADSKAIRFFTCHICSLTFIQENYYNQHMDTHKSQTQKKPTSSSMVSTVTSGISTSSSTTSAAVSQSLIRGDSKDTNDGGSLVMSGGANNTASISEADIESIFEKMHSDKSDNDVATGSGAGDSAAGSGDNLVITSQENAVGGITFNITIPQPDSAEQGNEAGSKQQQQQASGDSSTTPVSVSIDMPVLDHPDEGMEKGGSSAEGEKSTASDDNAKKPSSPASASGSSTHPVSMPSLDDDNEGQDSNSQHSTTTLDQQSQQESSSMVANQESEDQQDAQQQHAEQNQEDENQQNMSGGDQVPMDLEDMQAGVEGGQIKFILNENGQLLQLDNHIITDADGNQILVQGTDSEQIQQLLQSVGVLQTSDGMDGETLQMIGDNNQMVIVQQGDNEPQLIDASLLNADGHIVIQQGQDGELGEGAHVIGEGGVRIPVSVSYTADGQPIVQVTQQPESGDGKDMDGTIITTTAGGETAVTQSISQAPGSYFALEDLMQQPEQSKSSD